MKTGTRLLILCLLAPAALAENMSLRSGRVLKDAVVVSSGDDFVNIQYTDGVAKVSYKDLTDAQQRDYRMTPDEVKARLDQRRMEEAARRKKAEEAIPADVQALVDARAAARKAKDFAKADELRAEIEAKGYEVKETRQGTQVRKRAD